MTMIYMNCGSEHHYWEEYYKLWFVSQSAIHRSDKEQTCRHEYKKFYNDYWSAHKTDQPRTLVSLILPQTNPTTTIVWFFGKNSTDQVMHMGAERWIVQRPVGAVRICGVLVPLVCVKIGRNWKPSSVAFEIAPSIQFTFILRTLAREFTIAVRNAKNSRQK